MHFHAICDQKVVFTYHVVTKYNVSTQKRINCVFLLFSKLREYETDSITGCFLLYLISNFHSSVHYLYLLMLIVGVICTIFVIWTKYNFALLRQLLAVGPQFPRPILRKFNLTLDVRSVFRRWPFCENTIKCTFFFVENLLPGPLFCQCILIRTQLGKQLSKSR